VPEDQVAFIQLNRDLAREWAPIVKKKAVLPDASVWERCPWKAAISRAISNDHERTRPFRDLYEFRRSLFARAQRVIAGGASRDAVLRTPHPIYAAKASGCYVTDVDGRRYVDFVNNMASLIHGHAFPPIVEAVTTQLTEGTAYTFATRRKSLMRSN